MSRARIAVALLLAAAGGVTALLATSVGVASNQRFHFTHRVVVVGQYVDHWTVSNPGDCGLVGDGTVTVNFRMAVKVRLAIDPFYGAEGAHGKGAWVLGSPLTPGHGDLPYLPATGTITLVDNTSARLPSCPPFYDKSECGTPSPLTHAISLINGYSRHLLVADLKRVYFDEKGGSGRAVKCGIGQAAQFTEVGYSGGNRSGELLVKMASVSTVAHQRVVRVTGTTHKRSAFTDCGGYACSDDVTRRVTVTFTRL